MVVFNILNNIFNLSGIFFIRSFKIQKNHIFSLSNRHNNIKIEIICK